MGKEQILLLISAILMLSTVLSLLSYAINIPKTSEQQDTDSMVENLSGLIVDFSIGEIVGTLVIVVSSIILGIVFFFSKLL